MINPASLMKLMSAKNKFVSNHPKFAAFLGMVFSRSLEAGTIIEVSVKRPNEEAVTANMKLQQSDLDLFQELKELAH